MSDNMTNNNKKSKKICKKEGCKKKIKITDMKCRCGNTYCSEHRIGETHDCSFNYQIIDKDKFMKQCGLGGGDAKKITVI